MKSRDKKVNPVCAIGSVATAVILLVVLLSVVALLLFSLDINTHGWPRLPRAVIWFCDVWSVGAVAFLLYPKCMKARSARRISL